MIIGIPLPSYAGHRTTYSVVGVIDKITEERRLRALFKKVKIYHIKITSKIPEGEFKNTFGRKVNFPEKFTIVDIGKNFIYKKTEDALEFEIGYSYPNEQYWRGLDIWSIKAEGIQLL
jgi:hypothetical protein